MALQDTTERGKKSIALCPFLQPLAVGDEELGLGARCRCRLMRLVAGGKGTGCLRSSFLSQDCLHPRLLPWENPECWYPIPEPSNEAPPNPWGSLFLKTSRCPTEEPQEDDSQRIGTPSSCVPCCQPSPAPERNREGGGLALPGVSRGGVSLGRELMKS